MTDALLCVRDLIRAGLLKASLELAQGECLAIRGASGSGKTLLLRAIADLDPASGQVLLEGVQRDRISAPIWRRRVAYVPAEAGWWAERVGPHFASWSAARGLVTRLGFTDAVREQPIARLSTGERQRLALARALAQGPRVLLLDEPTSGLDPDAAREVEAIVAERLASGCGALWVTHDGEQARRVARRVLWMKDGRTRLGAT